MSLTLRTPKPMCGTTGVFPVKRLRHMEAEVESFAERMGPCGRQREPCAADL